MINIGEPGISLAAWLYNVVKFSSLSTFLIPLPPPPSEALIITGNPIFLAFSNPSSGPVQQPLA